MAYSAGGIMNVDLGVQGENLARTIEFDVTTFLGKWPDAKISLLVKRKRDTQPYVAVTNLKDNILYWPVTATETEFAGEGKLEIRVISGVVIAKSATGKFTVQASMTGSEAEMPEASQGWVNQVLSAGNEAATSAALAKQSAQIAQEAAAKLGEQETPVLYVFISTDDMSTGTADKSIAEIVTAVESGRVVFAVLETILIPLIAQIDEELLFLLSIPQECTIALRMSSENNVNIDMVENDGSAASKLLVARLSDDLTIDKSFGEIADTLENGGMVYLLYRWGTTGVVFMHPVFVDSQSGIVFVGEVSSLRFSAMLKSDGSVTIDDNIFDQHVSIRIEQDEKTAVYWVSSSWTGTAIDDEIAIGRSVSAFLPGVGYMTYTGSIRDNELNSILPVFEAHCWDAAEGAFTFVQARFLSDDYVLDDGSWQKKVEVIRWKLPGERITQA